MIFQFTKKLNAANGHFRLEVDAEITEGNLITLYGESGAGKTSILRMLAGLLQPERGYLKVGEEVWYSAEEKINLSPQQRKIGIVFQDYALFPNMTVRQNLEFALDKNQDKRVIAELVDLIELGDLQYRRPETLSGGQKQRVALARALVRRPKLLLLDEPLSALNKAMRDKLQNCILKLHRNFNLTTFLVSHEVKEVFKMSNEVWVLKDGKITSRSTPLSLFSQTDVSGKFKFTGEVIDVEKSDVIFIITILVANNIVKVVADEREASQLSVGDEVLVASKAFNPLIQKIN
ncbi:sulfate/molybdate ABC transporter ATP-binding protein [Flammeovirgaceae bacterium]